MKCRPPWRASVLPIVLLAAIFASAASAVAETPPGPRLAYQRFIGYPDVYFTTAPEGGEPESLVDFGVAALPRPASSAGFSWSPDGTSFVYAGVRGGGPVDSKPRQRALFIAPTSGDPAVEIPASTGAERPVFAPDGNSVAALRIRLAPRRAGDPRRARRREQSSIWLLSLDGTTSRRLTPWRPVFSDVPWSFKPDGSALGIIGCPVDVHRCRGEAIALSLLDGSRTRIAAGAAGLAYSPDGSRVALLRPGRSGEDLWVGAADGTDLRLVNDGARGEDSPTWDPSGRRLAFVMAPAPTFHPNFGFYGNAIWQVNADGTCPTQIRTESSSYAILSPSWQPGPGRGAGTIIC